jgi:hypothetical protein
MQVQSAQRAARRPAETPAERRATNPSRKWQVCKRAQGGLRLSIEGAIGHRAQWQQDALPADR